MSAPLIARIFGALLLIAGIAGFAPIVSTAMPFDAPVVTIDASYRMLAGLFAVNAATNVFCVLFGIAGLMAGAMQAAAAVWCRLLGWLYLALSILGSIAITNTLFGIAPIYGNDIWLHALFGITLLLGGYVRAPREDFVTP